MAVVPFLIKIYMAEEVKQPDEQLQVALDAVLSDTPTEYEFLGKRRQMGWLRNGTMRRFSHVTVKDRNEHRRNCKLLVLAMLNNIWKIRLMYWFLWRWYYYIKDINDADILVVLDVAKKKIPLLPSQLATILATGMTDLMMTMTKSEARRTQAEQAGAAPSA